MNYFFLAAVIFIIIVAIIGFVAISLPTKTLNDIEEFFLKKKDNSK